VSAVQGRDPAALGRGLAEALRCVLAAFARDAAFAAVLALPLSLLLRAAYAGAFLFALAAAATLDAGRSILRRAARTRR
jgi:hypothetical protein